MENEGAASAEDEAKDQPNTGAEMRSKRLLESSGSE